MLLATSRLALAPSATEAPHVNLVCNLWNDPRVMRWVGFPDGLHTTPEEITSVIERRSTDLLEAILIVQRTADCALVGHCKLGRPDASGVSENDIKLLPEYWGYDYGTEIKLGLVDYLFTHTACRTIRATPHRDNRASLRMQEAVGARLVGEAIFRFETSMKVATCDVPHYIYEITRDLWDRNRRGSSSGERS